MEKGMLVMEGTPKQVFSQAQKLKKMGLALPQASEMMNKLRNKGFDVREGILTNDEAFVELVRILKQDIKG